MEQKYRTLEAGDTIQEGDEVWEFGRGPWEPVSRSEHGQEYRNGYWRMRRPVATEITDTKQQLESLTKSWYDQCADLAEAGNQITDLTKERDEMERGSVQNLGKFIDARNQITDITRRLEDAMSEKVVAEKARDQAVMSVSVHYKFRQEIAAELGLDIMKASRNEIIGHIRHLEAQIRDKDATIRRLKDNVTTHTNTRQNLLDIENHDDAKQIIRHLESENLELRRDSVLRWLKERETRKTDPEFLVSLITRILSQG